MKKLLVIIILFHTSIAFLPPPVHDSCLGLLSRINDTFKHNPPSVLVSLFVCIDGLLIVFLIELI